MKLDPDAPIRSLRELTGLTQTAAAAARDVAQPSQSQAEAAGSNVSIGVLLEAARRWGWRVDLVATELDDDD